MAAASTQVQRIRVDAQGPVIAVTFSRQVNETGMLIQLEPGALMFIEADDAPAGLAKIIYKLDDQPALIYRTPLSGFVPGKNHTITIIAEDLLENRTQKVVHLLVREQPK
jgi:hypothetical protein